MPDEELFRAPAMPEIETCGDLQHIPDDGHPLDGADPEQDNVRRASFAAQAVIRYAQVTRGWTRRLADLNDSPLEVISDLLGDLGHLLDVLREFDDDGYSAELDQLFNSGMVHYEAEIRGEL